MQSSKGQLPPALPKGEWWSIPCMYSQLEGLAMHAMAVRSGGAIHKCGNEATQMTEQIERDAQKSGDAKVLSQ
jgi:hypothetical protein